MSERKSTGNWWQHAFTRFTTHWPLKSFGTIAYISAFMAVYFWLLRHPAFPVFTMPLTPLDRLIPFESWSLLPYATLWLYISLVPALLHLRREMAPYLSAVTLLSLTGFAIFFFWPTAVPKPDVDWAQHPSIQFLKSVDTAGNACPSLHVAFAVLTALWLHRLLKHMAAPILLQFINVAWCVLIAYSTLATKQHVALDLETGALLGFAVAALHLYVLPRFGVLDVALESA
ncbi:MAG TPA: phosphatase PAP2 family protein [Gammaproteobacteria bacterium]|nr:phosphatase PAP2 family protein [Gammaproteobacteria bacterium]